MNPVGTIIRVRRAYPCDELVDSASYRFRVGAGKVSFISRLKY